MKRNPNSVYIRVLLVVLSIVFLLAFINRSPRHVGHDSWLPSSFNPSGAGSMALYQTLDDLHWPVERWREPLSRLTRYGTGNVLIITRSASGSRGTFSEQEIDLLDDWVKSGNTLLLLGALGDWADTRDLMREAGFVVPEKLDSISGLIHSLENSNHAVLELQPTYSAGQIGTLLIPQSDPLPLTYPSGAKVLWENAGSPYVIKVPRGGGRMIFAASDRLLSNRYLAQGNNLAVVLSLLAPSGIAPRHLLFEESHHGYSAIFAITRLLDDRGIEFAIMLALLGALAFFGTAFTRFGPIVPLERDAGRSTLEFVDSIADLYLRADLRNDTLKFLFNETHQQVLRRLNLPQTASHEVIASRLQQGYPHLPKWKKLAQRFDSRDYIDGLPPGGWLHVAKDLIEIKSATA